MGIMIYGSLVNGERDRRQTVTSSKQLAPPFVDFFLYTSILCCSPFLSGFFQYFRQLVLRHSKIWNHEKHVDSIWSALLLMLLCNTPIMAILGLSTKC